MRKLLLVARGWGRVRMHGASFRVMSVSLCILIVVPIATIFSVPSFSLSFGDIFFGGIKPLYNVQLAQLFYKSSAYPFFSELPPRYAHHQLSRTYFIQGHLESALHEAKRELEIYPDDTATYYILGLTYGYMNLEHEAIDAFSKYIETHPATWAGRNDKAWLQFRIGDIDGALETLRPVVNNTGNPWIQNTYGTLLMNKKRYTEAEKAFEYAQQAVNTMTESSWGRSYPGNDPRIYGIGLQAMKMSIEQNLILIRDRVDKQ